MRVLALTVALTSLVLSSCREDIELAPIAAGVPEPPAMQAPPDGTPMSSDAGPSDPPDAAFPAPVVAPDLPDAESLAPVQVPMEPEFPAAPISAPTSVEVPVPPDAAVPMLPEVPVLPEDCSAGVPDMLVSARPPMGWNGYNAFGCDAELDEAKLDATVQALIDSGMQSAGYRYVNLDDCWELPRSAEGQRVVDPARLPGGIVAFSERVHARGLLFGVRGTVQGCGPTPGSLGYEATDAATYASWGVDYVKYVQCDVAGQANVVAMAEALAEHRMVLSLAAPPFQEWMSDVAQLWRTAFDIKPTWESIVTSIDSTMPLAAYARPGAFNDPDMLEVGNGDLTVGEQRVQFAVWSILSAPLLAGNDLTVMSDETRDILTNDDLIALNQDPLGLQAALLRREGDVDILAKPLATCGARGVVLWNRGTTSADILLSPEELWLEPEDVTVSDLWDGTALSTQPDGFSVTVPGHDAVALRVVGTEPPLPRGQVHLSDLRWTYATNSWGPVELDTTNGEADALDGEPIRLRGAAYDKGLGVHGPSLIRYRLGQACSRFVADIGIDDSQAGEGSAQFEVWADGERIFRSGVVTGTSPTQTVDIDVRDKRDLRLFVGLGGDTNVLDHAVWAGAILECEP